MISFSAGDQKKITNYEHFKQTFHVISAISDGRMKFVFYGTARSHDAKLG